MRVVSLRKMDVFRRRQPFAEHIRFATRYAGLSTECEGAALAMPRLPTA